MADEDEDEDTTKDIDDFLDGEETEVGEDTLEGGQQHEEGTDKVPDPKKPKAEEQSDDLKAALADLTTVVTSLKKPEKEKEVVKELTAEQKAEMWGVFDPTKDKKDFMKKWFKLNPDCTPEEESEAKELFDFVHSGLMKQALKGSQNLVALAEQRIMDKFGPVLERVQKQEAEQSQKQIRQAFDKTYPVLADPKYAKILKAVATDLEGQDFPDQNAFFKVLAEGTAAAIKTLVPDFVLTEKPNKQSAGTSGRLPRTRVGGSGGAGGGNDGFVKSKTDGTDEFLDD